MKMIIETAVHFTDLLMYLPLLGMILFVIIYVFLDYRKSKKDKEKEITIEAVLNKLERLTVSGSIFKERAGYDPKNNVAYIWKEGFEDVSVNLWTNELTIHTGSKYNKVVLYSWKEYGEYLKNHPLLVEDEVDHNAYAYFKNQFKELIGTELDDWKKFATRKDNGDNIRYYFNDLELIDEPWGHSLIKLMPKNK